MTAQLFSARRLALHTASYATAGVAGKLLTIATVPILTRLLGTEEYGLVDLGASLAALLTLVARFGGEVSAARQYGTAVSDSERAHVLGAFVLATAAVSVGLAGIALALTGQVTVIWAAPDRGWLALLSIALVPVSAIQVALVTVVRLSDRPVQVAVLATLDLVAQMLFALVFVGLGAGAEGVILGYFVGSVVGAAAAGGVAHSTLDLRPGVARLLAVIRRGLPYLPAFVAFVLADQVARVVVANALGVIQVGQLALAIRVGSVMALATSAFSLAWGPQALQWTATSATAEVFRTVLARLLFIALLATVALGILAPEVMLLAGGSQFVGGAPAVPGLLWAAALGGAYYVLATAAGVKERGRAVAVASVVGAVTQIALVVVLTGSMGLEAVGASSVVGRLASIGIVGWSTRDFVQLSGRYLGGTVVLGSILVFVIPRSLEADAMILRFGIAAIAIGVALRDLAIRVAASRRTSLVVSEP